MIDGVREGRSVTFDDGEPVATAEWVAGKLEGPAVRTSRRTGRVLEEAFYKDGRLDGERGFTAMTAPCSEVKPMRAACSTGW